MADIEADLTRVTVAFDRPTLTLLASRWANLTVTLMRQAFSQDQRYVACDHLHIEVDRALRKLRAGGTDVPSKTGRELCRDWAKQKWISREPDPDNGPEIYRLTSHALEALDIVEQMSDTQVLISESRITTILHLLQRQAHDADPDIDRRIARLDDEIKRLQDERDRLTDGGSVAIVDDTRMLDDYANAMALIRQLPSDFKRVEESFQDMHQRVLGLVREDTRPASEILDHYLARYDHLITTTPEGRGFHGALELLRDNTLLDRLNTDIETILAHSFASQLTRRDLSEFRGTVSMIRGGLNDVLNRRQRLTSTLREHINNHDAIRERELDQVFRDLARELPMWMSHAGVHAKAPVELLPATARTLPHLRERMFDPDEATVPPPLETDHGQVPAAVSLDDLLQHGGPSFHRLRDILRVRGHRDESLGELFNDLPTDLRRPVEILGLLHLAADAADAVAPDLREAFHAIRSDGTTRTFAVPRIALTAAQVAAIVNSEDHS